MEVRNPNTGESFRVNVGKVVFTNRCAHCSKDFYPGQILMTVSHPYLCLMHANCVQFYDYSNGWPHDKPLTYYEGESKLKPNYI
jgi:hypothetical protein